MVSLRAHFIPVSFSSGGVKDIYTISERTDGGVVDEKQLVVAHPKKNLRLFGPGNYIIENGVPVDLLPRKGRRGFKSNFLQKEKKGRREETGTNQRGHALTHLPERSSSSRQYSTHSLIIKKREKKEDRTVSGGHRLGDPAHCPTARDAQRGISHRRLDIHTRRRRRRRRRRETKWKSNRGDSYSLLIYFHPPLFRTCSTTTGAGHQ